MRSREAGPVPPGHLRDRLGHPSGSGLTGTKRDAASSRQARELAASRFVPRGRRER
ncbi:MAG: hypothetical protein AVDCRST_MAG70-1620 [uncultured Thermomicrobiales bacterium]|uniref:Uncharacterized protein n=1 Tax=uncultured Thermomicrobiales bacterium TaxID=1645740 RepID=A0A6J4UYG3_9BACT|nr:MAG: hypothetical protein AVDCRST_MAG70-1620 [uncultured Thermomicrobiales bacterium]